MDSTQFIEGSCPYYSNRKAITEVTHISNFSPKDLEDLLIAGFRHFGRQFFRPACEGCNACIPYRIVLKNFTLSRWQRRIIKKELQISQQPISILDAYNLYRKHKERFSDTSEESVSDFAISFFLGYPSARILPIVENDGTLISVCHFDEMPNSLSAIYTYYNYEKYSNYSLGSHAILTLALKAQSLGKKYLYLGYYLKDHPHMGYKSRFYPAEILETDGSWKTFLKNGIILE